MKKIIYLLALCAGIPVFSHAQQVSKDLQWVDIHLTGVQHKEKDGKPSNHLYMYDSNGAKATDSLVTVFCPKIADSTVIYTYKIKWHIAGGNIASIISIHPVAQPSIIFQRDILEDEKGVYVLDLPTDRPAKGEIIREAYIIEYRTTDASIESASIDPYIDIRPPSP